MCSQHKDGVSSWVVLIGVVFCTFLQTGVVNSLGVLLPVLQIQFETDSSLIGQAISTTLISGSILGLLGQELHKRRGPRLVVVASGFISTLGLLIAALSSHIIGLIIGILSTSVVFVAETVMIGILPCYFDRYHRTAVSLCLCGTSLGVMVLPPLTDLLLQQYGWRGTMLMLAGISFHLVASGALLSSGNSEEPENVSLIQSTNTDLRKDEHPITFLDALQNTIDSVLDLHLLNNVSFIVVLIASGVYGYTFGGWGIYIVSLLQSKGLSSLQAAWIATIGGFGKLVTMISLPYLNSNISERYLMYVSSALLCISMVTTPLNNSYAFLGVTSALFGIGQAMLSVEVYVVANKVAGEVNGVAAVAWMHVFYGVFGTLGGLLTGWLYEATLSSTVPFISIGAVSLLEALALGLEDLIQYCKSKPI